MTLPQCCSKFFCRRCSHDNHVVNGGLGREGNETGSAFAGEQRVGFPMLDVMFSFRRHSTMWSSHIFPRWFHSPRWSTRLNNNDQRNLKWDGKIIHHNRHKNDDNRDYVSSISPLKLPVGVMSCNVAITSLHFEALRMPIEIHGKIGGFLWWSLTSKVGFAFATIYSVLPLSTSWPPTCILRRL